MERRWQEIMARYTLQYNGIDLLQNIKDKMIPNNSIIKVYKKLDDKSKTLVCYLLLTDGEIRWKEKCFKLSMLLDDKYVYEVVDIQPIDKALTIMDIDSNKINKIIKYIVSIVYGIE